MKNNPKILIIHHTAAPPQSFEIVNEYHRQKWNFKSSLGYYIGYHYYIDEFGKVWQGRADDEEGAHTIGKNLESIGICLAGNFDITLPSTEQVKSLRQLLVSLADKYHISANDIVPHRFFANKSCYGRNLSDNWARNLYLKEKISQLWAKVALLLKLKK